MNNPSGKEGDIPKQSRHHARRYTKPVLFTLLAVVVLAAGILIFFHYCNSGSRHSKLFPFLGVEGIWADSVLTKLSMEEKLAQLLILEGGLNSQEGEGYILMPDSLSMLKEGQHLSAPGSVEPFRMVQNTDPLTDCSMHLSVQEILSNRSDSLIRQYLIHHLEASGLAGASMVTYPLVNERPLIPGLHDTLYFAQQVRLSAFFTEEAMKRGIIPVMPMPGVVFALQNSGNGNHPQILKNLKKLIHPKLPALLIDSLPEHLKKTKGITTMLADLFGFTGLIILRQDTSRQTSVRDAVEWGADILQIQSRSSLSQVPDPTREALVNQAVTRVLHFKEWLLLFSLKTGEPDPGIILPGAISTRQLQQSLRTGSVILLADPSVMLPLKLSGNHKYHLHLPATTDFSAFTECFANFAEYRITRYRAPASFRMLQGVTNLVFLEDGNALLKFCRDVMPGNKSKTLILYFGKLEDIALKLPGGAFVYAPGNDPQMQRILANFLFGGTCCNGRVPCHLSQVIRAGQGLPSPGVTRLNFTIPEEAGIDPAVLLHIDSIIGEAIRNAAFPGCQVLIARNGNVFLHKAYGHTTFEKHEPVTLSHLYDLSSVTNIAATTLAFMKMYEKGKMKLTDPLGRFFRDQPIRNSDLPTDTLVKEDTLILTGSAGKRKRELATHSGFRRINDTVYLVTDTLVYSFRGKPSLFTLPLSRLLTHQSGLSPFLPFSHFINTFDRAAGKNRFPEYFSPAWIRDSATCMVAEGMYLYRRFEDTLWDRCKGTGLNSKAGYVYSDANLVWLQMAIDSVNRKPLSGFIGEQVYSPMGLRRCTFQPLNQFSKNRIVPASNDIRWRKQEIQGTVYDPAAALLGGVAGHAGLFSNAGDLGAIAQMLLQGGSYGGEKYFDTATVNLFTSPFAGSNRGLGFDIQPGGEKSLSAPSASTYTYGHNGFTGTSVWIDPEQKLVFVFLSNRTYPNAENQKIDYFRVRQQVLEVVYQALKEQSVKKEQKTSGK